MNLQAIDLNLLLVFEALLEERNVTRAAKRVGLSQPAMSNALSRLRRVLEDPLFTRTGEGMTPTPVAQALSGPVRSGLEKLREAFETNPVFDPAGSDRRFHLYTSDYTEFTLIAPMLRRLGREKGSVKLQILRSTSVFEPPPSAVLANSIDLAIGFYPNILGLDPQLRSERLWEENNVCIASAKHPTIRGRITLKQFGDAWHAAHFSKTEGPGVIDAILSQKGYVRRIAVQSPNFGGIPFLVSAGELIAVVPERIARLFKRQAPIQILPLPFDLPPFVLTLVWHQRHHTDPASRWLRQLLMETAVALCDSSKSR
jgi:DNA-binding transcriptional LysR family regulator